MTDATETAEGAIPHLRMRGLRLPVMLDFDRRSAEHPSVKYPLRTHRGELLFALPGGGCTVAPVNIDPPKPRR